jgi:hypothetical protein
MRCSREPDSSAAVQHLERYLERSHALPITAADLNGSWTPPMVKRVQ